VNRGSRFNTGAVDRRRGTLIVGHPDPPGLQRAALGGVDPTAATMKLADYGTAHMSLALRGLEAKTLDPYLSGWRKRVVPTLGHLPVRMITNGAVD
jgi:hypothetical protein